MTIHQDKGRKPYVMLADIPVPDRAVLFVWLVGLDAPPVEDVVYLDDCLRVVRERRQQRRAGSAAKNPA